MRPQHGGAPSAGRRPDGLESLVRLEDALRRSERNLADAQRISHIGSWERDLVTGALEWSDESHRMFGIEPGTFTGTLDAYLAFVHPDDRGKAAPTRADLRAGDHRVVEYRIVRPDGAVRLLHEESEAIGDASGVAIRYVGSTQDITEQRHTQEALVASELRYAAIFEGTAEAILIAELATGCFRWVNSAACALLGYTRDELLQMALPDLHPSADLPWILEQFRADVENHITETRSVPCMRKDGSVLLANIRASTAVVDGVACNIGFFTDVTELRRLETQDHLLAQAVEQVSDAIMITSPTAEIRYANPAFERLSGLRREDVIGAATSILGDRQSPEEVKAMWRDLSSGRPWTGNLDHRRPDGTDRVAEASISPVHDADGTLTGYVAVERDVTAERALASNCDRLDAAVQQTSDSVLIADLSGAIEFVNPAFEKMSGYRRDEVIGQNPRILKSGRQSGSFYRALWRRLARGQTWSGKFFNCRADGSLYEVEATISPIHGQGGEITGYIGIERDVTALHAARSSLANEFRERAQAAAALSRLQPRGSAEATGADICDELLGLSGVDVAAIIVFPDPDLAVTLAVAGPDGLPVAPGRPLPAARAAYLYGRAAQGPWAEMWRARPEDGQYGRQLARLGLRATAYAPIRNGEGLLGLILAGTTDEVYARHLVDHLPVIGEFAATASALLARDLEGDRARSRRQTQIAKIITRRAFYPVFQPIVALDGGEIVGYEALTRFTDGTRPDLLFAESWTVDLGADLEFATLDAAITLARGLPVARWLNVNVSPRLLDDPARVRAVLATAGRPVIVEITEHDRVADYGALRHAIEKLGGSIRTAVDDAGAGAANFAHIIELRPDFVKLDISLVRGVNVDLGRQAIVVAMRHFARASGCRLIAEGVETAAEAATIMGLGVEYGQGHFYGRPETIAARAAPAAEPAS